MNLENLHILVTSYRTVYSTLSITSVLMQKLVGTYWHSLFLYQIQLQCMTSVRNECRVNFTPLFSGIVYAHRNENVVNMGPGNLGQKEAGTHENFTGKTLSKTRGNSLERIYNMGRLSSEQRKRNEFRSIAHNMGMAELEFSKWLLSASPSQRIEVLQNYKEKKKQMIGPMWLPKDK